MWAAVAKGARWAVKMAMAKAMLAREVAVARGAVVELDSGDQMQGRLAFETWWWRCAKDLWVDRLLAATKVML